MRIVFVRHGEPNYERDCLTPLGYRQAQAAAERLAGEGVEAVYSSPQGRALETARASAAALGLSPVQILDFMHEIYWDSIDGAPLFAGGNPWNIADEMVRQGWDLTRTDWREHPLFRNNRAVRENDKVGAALDRWLSGLGYEREGLYYRCRGENARRTVALFSHGGSSTAALSRLLNLPFPYLCATMHQPFTGITVIRLDSRPGSLSAPVLELAGDGKHLDNVQ